MTMFLDTWDELETKQQQPIESCFVKLDFEKGINKDVVKALATKHNCEAFFDRIESKQTDNTDVFTFFGNRKDVESLIHNYEDDPVEAEYLIGTIEYDVID